jgi:hypothetical protein
MRRLIWGAAEFRLVELVAGIVEGNEAHFSMSESTGDGGSDVHYNIKYIPLEYIIDGAAGELRAMKSVARQVAQRRDSQVH